MPFPRRLAISVLCAGALLLAGCGSATVAELPPPAGPGPSPALSQAPAGQVFEVGSQPEGVAFDPVSGRLGVALRDPDEVALVDPDAGAVLGTVALPGPARHLAPGEDRGELLAPAAGSGQVVVVSAPRERVAGRLEPGGRPHAAIAAGGQVLATDPGRGSLVLVDGLGEPQRVPIGPAPEGIAALHGGRQVAVVAARTRTLDLFDTATGRRLASVPAGVGPTHVVSESRFHRLYVTDTQGDALLVFETEPELELVRRVYMPGRPYAIAVDEESHRLWVTQTRSNELVELPAHGRPYPLRTLPAVRQPDSLAVDEATGRVFVAGRHDGVVQVVEP